MVQAFPEFNLLLISSWYKKEEK